MSIRTMVMGIVGMVSVMATAADTLRDPLLDTRPEPRLDTRQETRVDTRQETRVDWRQEPRFKEGDRTFTISGSGSSDNDFDGNIAAMEVGLGWLVADDLAVELRQELAFADVPDDDDWSGSTRLGLDYFLNFGRCKPFLGGNIGYIYGDTVEEQFIAGPDVGVRCFVNQTTFVSLAIEYQFLFENTHNARDTYDDGRYVYALGMGVKW